MKNTLNSLKAVADETRIRILLILIDREACVCELMSVFRMTQSKLSHHLITLRNAGFLQDDKRGKWNYYRLNTKLLTPANRELIISLDRWLSDDETIAQDKKTLTRVKKRMQVCT